MAASKISFIGAGPGNPELITLRGHALLKQADVIFYDFALSPAFFHACSEDCRLVPVRHEGHASKEALANVAQRMVEAARSGHRVVRLKVGDPLFFSRTLEDLETVCEAGIAIEIVPGIASPLAASAFAGVPLTEPHGSRGLVFTSATDLLGRAMDAHAFISMAEKAETLCIMLVVEQLRAVVGHLSDVSKFRHSPALLVHRASLPEQRVIEAPLLDLIAQFDAHPLPEPSLLIVGNVVRYRRQLAWFESRPLFGKRLLLCRAREQAQDSASAILQRGAAPELLPLIEIEAYDNDRPLFACIPQVAKANWVIFTSANGVERFRRAVIRAGKDARIFGSSRIAVIGPGTARPLEQWGIKPELIAKEHVAENLASELLASGPASSAILIRALEARDTLPESLRAAGISTEIVPAYQTRKLSQKQREPLLARLHAHTIDAVLLTSSSMADSLVMALGDSAAEVLSRVCVASIGPITSATLEKHGVTPSVTATTYTVEGLLDALEIHFEQNGAKTS